MVGVAGPVAVGKSAVAAVLSAALPPTVAVVSTDGFLFPNDELERRGLSMRKGFPETFDVERLVRFLDGIRARRPDVCVPMYSHLTYDVVPGEGVPLGVPDTLVIEGVNVLQPGIVERVDFGVYVDADEADVARWFRDRMVGLVREARHGGAAFYSSWAAMSDDDVGRMAQVAWDQINAVNLREHIAPTREQADVVVEKGPDHEVRRLVVRSAGG